MKLHHLKHIEAVEEVAVENNMGRFRNHCQPETVEKNAEEY